MVRQALTAILPLIVWLPALTATASAMAQRFRTEPSTSATAHPMTAETALTAMDGCAPTWTPTRLCPSLGPSPSAPSTARTCATSGPLPGRARVLSADWTTLAIVALRPGWSRGGRPMASTARVASSTRASTTKASPPLWERTRPWAPRSSPTRSIR